MIDGVKIKKLQTFQDERGFLMEIIRSDDEIFEKFGQVYMTMVKRGVAKAWHHHELQDDHFACVYGKALVVLCDMRKESPTHKEVQEFYLSSPTESNGEQLVVKIPKGVAHGFTAVDCDEARIVNITTKLYNYKEPDEQRYPWNTKEIPYQWPKDVTSGG